MAPLPDEIPFETLPAIAGGWETREFDVAGRTIHLTLPAAPDELLDDPEVLAAHARDGYMPYWGYLWPTSLETAAWVLSAPRLPATSVIELGAGIGLTGMAALAAGCAVTFSDYDRQAVRLALYNARRNNLAACRGVLLDWRAPVREQHAWMIGCDIIYEVANHGPILNVLDAMLAPKGECWLTDPGRCHAEAFVRSARSRGYECRSETLARLPFPSRPEGVTHLWKLCKAG